MSSSRHRLPTRALGLAALLWLLVRASGFGGTTNPLTRVLIVDSFGRDVAPWNVIEPAFKAELTRQITSPIEFRVGSRETGDFGDVEAEAAFARYLRALYPSGRPAVAALIGPPAMAFWERQGHSVFPQTPTVLCGVDDSMLQGRTLPSSQKTVVMTSNLPALIGIILQVLPQTTNIAVVGGDSRVERTWFAECRKAWQPYAGRVGITWLTHMPFEEQVRRVAVLPPGSAVGYSSMILDATGIPYEHSLTLDRVCAEANAPVFGTCEEQFGYGIVGGLLVPLSGLGREAARVAAHVLKGEPCEDVRVPGPGSGAPVFDWRQLRRWRIDEASLPPGSTVRFRQPGAWEQYRWYILGALAVILCQGGALGGLLLQRTWRRRAEKRALEVGGRLITAQEEERRRIARDLHDDMNQRLALLSVELDLAGREPAGSQAERVRRLEEMGGQVRDLSLEVHKLSYQLHPAKLDQLGLATAARTLCGELSVQSGLRIGFTHEDIPRGLPAEVALCLYRVLQEALGNAIRHSGAADASVRLWRSGGHVHLTVSDTGRGFDLGAARYEGGLGLLSMQERARLVDGELAIRSTRGGGTRVELKVPEAGHRGASR